MPDSLVEKMIDTENEVVSRLRMPSDEERTEGIRATVLPVAAVVVH